MSKPDNAPERDAHLLAALRHAPDAQLQPPAQLRAVVLAAAHRAAAERPRQPPAQAPRRRAWFHLGPGLPRWRMGTSGALATVLLAGVIGLMWQGAPPGPAREAADEAAVDAARKAPPAPAPTMAPAAAPEVTPAAARDIARAAAPPLTVGATTRAPQPAPSLVPAPATAPTPALATAPAPAPAPDPAPTAADAAPSRLAARMPLAEQAAGPAPAAKALQQRIDATARAIGSDAAPRSTPPWGAQRRQGANWAWLESAPDGAASRAPPPDPETLDELAGLTAAGWLPDAGALPGDDALALQLLRDGRSVGRLWLDDQRALWCPAAGACLAAPLAAQAATTLRARLQEKRPR